MPRTITSANSVFTLVIPTVFPVPIQIQGFASDDAFDIGNSKAVEVRKGVDGRKSSGYTPFLVEQTIHLQADSPSIDLFDQWLQAMKAIQEDLPCSGSIVIASVGKIYTLSNGSLIDVTQMPANKKVLEPQVYTISWDKIDVANF